MPQVDYTDIPVNETAEIRRTSVRSNSGNRIDSIIDEIKHTRRNRPQINTRDDRDYAGSNSVNINRNNSSFIQTHPFLFGITLLILIIAIISSLASRQNFSSPPFIANIKPVDQTIPIQTAPEPIKTVPNDANVSQVDNWEVNSPYQDTEPQELTTDDRQNEIQAVNSVSTELEPTRNDKK